MREFLLPYGKETLKAEIEEEHLAGVLVSELHDYKAPMEGTQLVQEALEHPIGTPRLCDMAIDKKKIVVISSDHTRPVPSRLILPVLLAEIRKGAPKAQITILVATGCHRATTEEELRKKLGPELAGQARVLVHDCDGPVADCGYLPSGGRLLLNKTALEADLLVAEGFIEPHFFAGFSGGRKSVLPGVSSAATVMANHCSEFIASEYARTGVLEGNPIHRDMIYAAEQAKLAFIINVVLDENKKVIRAYAGDFNEAHREGCRFVDQMSGVDAIPPDIVISTNGGYPLDQNIYQSVKGMTAAEASCNPGGVIIMVSSCIDGHGGQSLYDTFASGGDKNVIMQRFLDTPRDKTIPDQWEAQILCRVLMHHKVIMVTQAPKQLVNDMQMDYAESVDEAIRMADAYLGKADSKITVIPDGVSVIVRRK